MNTKDGNYVALTRCFFCGGDNQILLHKRLGDLSHLHNKVVNMEPCPKCAELMKQGVLFIETRDHETGQTPYRTGRQWVIRDEAVRRMFNDSERAEAALINRMCYIEESIARRIGFPHDDSPPEQTANNQLV